MFDRVPNSPEYICSVVSTESFAKYSEKLEDRKCAFTCHHDVVTKTFSYQKDSWWSFRDRLKISLLILSQFKRMN